MSSSKEEWRAFFINWKKFWRNPDISPYEKAIVFNVFLYRSDEKGWSISLRKMAKDLGITKSTTRKYLDSAIKRGFLLTGPPKERKRRKLRLSGQLRGPGWVKKQSTNWAKKQPSKYQSKDINNKREEKNFSFKREKPLEKPLKSEEIHKLVGELKGRFPPKTSET